VDVAKTQRSPEFNDRVLASIRAAQSAVISDKSETRVPAGSVSPFRNRAAAGGVAGRIECGAATDSLWQVSVSGLSSEEAARLFSAALVAEVAVGEGPAVQVLCTRCPQGMRGEPEKARSFASLKPDSEHAGSRSTDGRRKRSRTRGKKVRSGKAADHHSDGAPPPPALVMVQVPLMERPGRRTDDIESHPSISRDTLDFAALPPADHYAAHLEGKQRSLAGGTTDAELCAPEPTMKGQGFLWTVDCVPASGGPARAVRFAVESLLGLPPGRARIVI
jgi:hypothetical protein